MMVVVDVEVKEKTVKMEAMEVVIVRVVTAEMVRLNDVEVLGVMC